jgi:peptidoglycan/xylan/chitin deacetylase (PgdA/CDA1 family)
VRILIAALVAVASAARADADDARLFPRVPILAYHRFGPVAVDAMTVTTATFESHLRYLRDHGYTVIPLRRLVDARLGRVAPPPAGAVVITVDDGHRSVYEAMLPLVRRYAVPVTAFIYPSAIGHADYALTWDQVRALRDSGWFEIASHTYWHPNFRTERARLAPAEYDRFVQTQLAKSRGTLEREIGGAVDLLAWPFGIYDADLAAAATRNGYVAAMALEGRATKGTDDLMALPRFLMSEQHRGAAFAALLPPLPRETER